jgi:AcrR family transcriptional regulator
MSSDEVSTRTRILEATWRLLEAGGSKVRMADIAKAAGISRQALYLHFPNRADLLVATTRHLDTVHDIDGLLAPSRAASTGVARLEHFIAAWAAHIPRIHGVAQALMAMQDSDEEARRAWADWMSALREGCAAAIAALAADGTLAPPGDERRATDLLMMLLAVPNWAYLTRSCGWDQATYADEITRLAHKALVAG